MIICHVSFPSRYRITCLSFCRVLSLVVFFLGISSMTLYSRCKYWWLDNSKWQVSAPNNDLLPERKGKLTCFTPCSKEQKVRAIPFPLSSTPSCFHLKWTKNIFYFSSKLRFLSGLNCQPLLDTIRCGNLGSGAEMTCSQSQSFKRYGPDLSQVLLSDLRQVPT